MKKNVARTIAGIILILVGFAVTIIFTWNFFALDLPVWANIPSTIIGMPLSVWGIMLIVNAYRKKI